QPVIHLENFFPFLVVHIQTPPVEYFIYKFCIQTELISYFYQPLTPPVVIPSIKYFWKKMKIKNTGSRETIDMANKGPHIDWPSTSMKALNASEIVYFDTELKYNKLLKKSFHVHINVKMALVAKAGMESGRIILK